LTNLGTLTFETSRDRY